MSASAHPSPGAPRVLVLGTVLGQPSGGVRRHNAELLPRVARLLDAAGGGLSILEGDARIEFELPETVERLEARIPPSPPLARAFAERRSLARVLAQARERGRAFELVHTAHLPVPRKLELPCTLTIHDLRHVDPLLASRARRFAANAALAAAARSVRAWITVSETVRAQLIDRLNLSPERVCVVPNAADHLQPLARPAAFEQQQRALVCIGHLEPRKNLELVLRALAARPELPPLILAGAGKRGEELRLRKLARALRIDERVRFVGPFPESELARLYAQAACLVLPSRLEGFGITVLEAQRARVPVCIARAGALVEVAGAGVPSFSPHDPIECAQAIERALATSARELDQAALQAARFTWQDSAQRLIDAWRAALA